MSQKLPNPGPSYPAPKPPPKPPASLVELDIIARLQEENDALKARLEEMRPSPEVANYLHDDLYEARCRCAFDYPDSPYRAGNVAYRDWLETILGESPESDPWKDRRGK